MLRSNFRKSPNLKRVFDLTVLPFLFLFLMIPFVLISFLIKITSNGPVFYWSDRIGRYNQIFSMPKFRTMHVETPSLATHLIDNPEAYLTPVGSFLRKSSLDELPQLWSILKGDMSFVGPRPALFNQYDLIALRNQYGIDKIVPGLTGWAQVNGRDELSIPEKVKFDKEYLMKRSFLFDIKILWLTVKKVMRSDNVLH